MVCGGGVAPFTNGTNLFLQLSATRRHGRIGTEWPLMGLAVSPFEVVNPTYGTHAKDVKRKLKSWRHVPMSLIYNVCTPSAGQNMKTIWLPIPMRQHFSNVFLSPAYYWTLVIRVSMRWRRTTRRPRRPMSIRRWRVCRRVRATARFSIARSW